MKQTLFLIPARGGSKGIPGKNIKLLNGKPLIQYAIDLAREFVEDDRICVSTDDEKIIEVCEKLKLKVPFVRPAELSTDSAGTYEVILHALDHYLKKGEFIDKIILLQPTSPFRKAKQIKEAYDFYDEDTDMVMGVQVTKANPYYVLMEENAEGYLELCKKTTDINTRQSAPVVYEINGAVYIINVATLVKEKSLRDFKRVKKYVMDRISSVDIDEPVDWLFAESIIKNGLFKK